MHDRFWTVHVGIDTIYRQQVDRLIRVQDKWWLLLSAFAVKSAWIQKEGVVAIEEQRHRNRAVLFPIMAPLITPL